MPYGICGCPNDCATALEAAQVRCLPSVSYLTLARADLEIGVLPRRVAVYDEHQRIAGTLADD